MTAEQCLRQDSRVSRSASGSGRGSRSSHTTRPCAAFNGGSARINAQVDSARQLAADNFVALLMLDDNKVFFFWEASTTLGWCGNW